MFIKKFIKSLLLSSVLIAPAFAVELAPTSEQQKIQKALEGVMENTHLVKVYLSDLPNFFILQIGGQTAMISKDGKFLIDGDVIDLDNRRSLLKGVHTAFVDKQINDIPDDQKVTFKAKDELAAIHVFSDIDCGYCRKLHNEITALNDDGITVHYLAFPRSGPDTKSWKKSENVWCAKNKQNAMTDAKQGKSTSSFPQSENCSVDIAMQYELGQKIGVRGTPSIIMPNGEMVPGYLPATQLVAKILSTPPQ